MRIRSIGAATASRGDAARISPPLALAYATAWFLIRLATLPIAPTTLPPAAIGADRESLRPEGWERVSVDPDGLKPTSGRVGLQPDHPDWPWLSWEIPVGNQAGQASLPFALPADAACRDTLWFGAIKDRLPGSVRVSIDVREEESWRTICERELSRITESSDRQLSAILPAGPAREGRVRVSWPTWRSPGRLRIDQIQLFRLSPSGKNDCWLFAGASITLFAARDRERMWTLAREAFPEADPLMMRLSGSGWTSSDLLRRLPGFLESHPHVRYVCLSIGGNDVSLHRPFPGGANRLRDNLTALLETVETAGKVPILARLPYRQYHRRPQTPPEVHGAGPYVEYLYDPLIARHCPSFFDPTRHQGVIDLYGYFRDHPEQLLPDGIHHTPEGQESWRRIWIHEAGRRIYGEPAPSTRGGSPKS